jgi:hypothetical protein
MFKMPSLVLTTQARKGMPICIADNPTPFDSIKTCAISLNKS